MSETSIYAPKWIAPCVADLVAQANFAIKLLQEGKLPAGAMSRAFSIVLEKHAPKDAPVRISHAPDRELGTIVVPKELGNKVAKLLGHPLPYPSEDKKEVVVAPPIEAIPKTQVDVKLAIVDDDMSPEEYPQQLTLFLKKLVSGEKIRLNALAEKADLPVSDVRKLIEAPGSGLKISGPGWVQLT